LARGVGVSRRMNDSKKTEIPASMLSESMDSEVWAHEFMRVLDEQKPELDVDLMRAWFANAIMAGYDGATQREKPRTLLGDPPGSHWVYDRAASETIENMDYGLNDRLVVGSPLEKALGAVYFAVRDATGFGTEDRIDPDALVQAFKRAWHGPIREARLDETADPLRP